MKKIHRYEGKDIVLTYDARRCIHAGECVRGLPAVFDPARRPWVVPDEADPAEVADVVRRWLRGSLTTPVGHRRGRARRVASETSS